MFDRGDIIVIDFDPSAGQEIQKTRPAFVLSRKIYSRITGLVIISPITSTIRGWNTEVPLPAALKTCGVVHTQQIHSFDYAARRARLIEQAPDALIEQVLKITRVYFS